MRCALIAIISIAIIGGALGYSYFKTDEKAVQTTALSFCGYELLPNDVIWHTPVFGALAYKQYETDYQKQEQEIVLNDTFITIDWQIGYEASVVMRDPRGDVVEGIIKENQWSHTVTQNGTYTYEIVVTKPKESKNAYGDWRFVGKFDVNVEPSITISPEVVSQGDIITVIVKGIEGTPEPTLEQNLSFASFAKTGPNYSAQIGVGYGATPGAYVVKVTCGELELTQTVTVNAATFERQDLTISSEISSQTNTEEANAQWREAIWSLYATADSQLYWNGVFMPPVENQVINTSYGLFRYTNGSTTAERHGGIDYDGEIGDLVYAPNNGRVVFAGFLTLTGNTVVIEHGSGLKSYFYHLDEIFCNVDDIVETQQQIATIGTTGYSTGPHLHYEVRIGNQCVNPISLFDGSSALYLSRW